MQDHLGGYDRGKFAYAMLVGPGSDAWCEYGC